MSADTEMEEGVFVSSPNRMLRISKELKKLQFSNPGEKMKRMTSTARRPRAGAGSVCQGNDGEEVKPNVCDCLNVQCPGCFLPCSKCQSNKCGVVCRSGRQWDYVREISDEM